MHTPTSRLKLVARSIFPNKEDSSTTPEPANLSALVQRSSLLLSLTEKLSGKTLASSRDRKADKGIIRVQPSQHGHVTDQEAKGDDPALSSKDGCTSKSLNASANSHKVLEESLSNTEYREPMIASLYV